MNNDVIAKLQIQIDSLLNRCAMAESKLAEIEAQEPVQPSPAMAVQYQSAVSGMWYSNPNAAGEICRVKVGDDLFVIDSGRAISTPTPPSAEQANNAALIKEILRRVCSHIPSADGEDHLSIELPVLRGILNDCIVAQTYVEQPDSAAVEPDIDEMVSRFLGWKLPKDFAPDCGISFNRESAFHRYEPIGTNLFTADQAKAMFVYALDYDRWPSTKEVIATIRDQQLNPFKQPDSAAPNEPIGYVQQYVVDKGLNEYTATLNPTAEGKYCVPIYISKPQRITEQHSRQLLKQFVAFWDSGKFPLPPSVDLYLDRPETKAQLAKLNEHREPDYNGLIIGIRSELSKMIKTTPALGAGWSENVVLNMGPFIMIPHIQKLITDCDAAIAKASASTDSGVK